MNSKQQFTLPSEPYRLEEINLPSGLARELTGRTVTAEVAPEEEAMTRQIASPDPGEGLVFITDAQGITWNDYWPVRVSFKDPQGEIWRIPRHWLTQGAAPLKEEAPYEVTEEVVWQEMLHLPSYWDLCDINITPSVAWRGSGNAWHVSVCARPHQQVEVRWQGFGETWRIPHDWRRRRIRLPEYKRLLENDVPPDVAAEFAGSVVSVNYHPGSLCCLPDGYRFRDGHGGKWPVRAADCVLMGYGDEEERLA
ncbi:MAG: hypothetical protein ACM3NO_03400 [Deltaproteobacteria bacterium]